MLVDFKTFAVPVHLILDIQKCQDNTVMIHHQRGSDVTWNRTEMPYDECVKRYKHAYSNIR